MKKRSSINIGEIPSEVWESLTHNEQDTLFIIDGAIVKRYSVLVMRKRLDQLHKLQRVLERIGK